MTNAVLGLAVDHDIIRVLMIEHAHILNALEAIAREARAVHAGRVPNRRLHERAHRFIRVHADAEHHAKEEGGLFAAMESAGFPKVGPLGCMVRQHSYGRELVGRMELALAGACCGDRAATEELSSATYEYCQMLAAHILMEDDHLYPAARRLLSPAALAELSSRFADGADERLAAFADAAAELQRMVE